jgi:hypothetical protein
MKPGFSAFDGPDKMKIVPTVRKITIAEMPINKQMRRRRGGNIRMILPNPYPAAITPNHGTST